MLRRCVAPSRVARRHGIAALPSRRVLQPCALCARRPAPCSIKASPTLATTHRRAGRCAAAACLQRLLLRDDDGPAAFARLLWGACTCILSLAPGEIAVCARIRGGLSRTLLREILALELDAEPRLFCAAVEQALPHAPLPHRRTRGKRVASSGSSTMSTVQRVDDPSIPAPWQVRADPAARTARPRQEAACGPSSPLHTHRCVLHACGPCTLPLGCRLPAAQTLYDSASKLTYYWNPSTNETTYQRPSGGAAAPPSSSAYERVRVVGCRPSRRMCQAPRRCAAGCVLADAESICAVHAAAARRATVLRVAEAPVPNVRDLPRSPPHSTARRAPTTTATAGEAAATVAVGATAAAVGATAAAGAGAAARPWAWPFERSRPAPRLASCPTRSTCASTTCSSRVRQGLGLPQSCSFHRHARAQRSARLAHLRPTAGAAIAPFQTFESVGFPHDIMDEVR